MVSGGNRCNIGVSYPYKLMGVGRMSTPTKPDDAGLDNVSSVLFILDYLYPVLDGRFNRRFEYTTDRPVY